METFPGLRGNRAPPAAGLLAVAVTAAVGGLLPTTGTDRRYTPP
ncbi:hypothetical protein [Streptomyces griseosporeus]